MAATVRVHRGSEEHWVGDGFLVRTVFSYHDLGQSISPFLLLDHAAPREFPPRESPPGVGEHPHRGFETVTVVYQGKVEHRDSGGNHGVVGPGDVQWMTAGAGVVHDEFHEREAARKGGVVEMVQLWVNLPAKHKRAPPRYQTLLASEIPSLAPVSGAEVRVIAGEFGGRRGPAQTFTPVDLFDLRLDRGARLDLPLPPRRTAALFVRHGRLLAGSTEARGGELALFESSDSASRATIDAKEDSGFLFLGGEPIAEPIAGYGPFVMNTEGEIQQAYRDYQSGRMGHLD